MITVAEINKRFANLGINTEIRRHTGSSLFFIVSLRDSKETILNSAMSLDWVSRWAAEMVRAFYRVHVVNGSAFYPATGSEPIFHG